MHIENNSIALNRNIYIYKRDLMKKRTGRGDEMFKLYLRGRVEMEKNSRGERGRERNVNGGYFYNKKEKKGEEKNYQKKKKKFPFIFKIKSTVETKDSHRNPIR